VPAVAASQAGGQNKEVPACWVAHRDMAEGRALAFQRVGDLRAASAPYGRGAANPGDCQVGSGGVPTCCGARKGGISVRWTSHRGYGRLVVARGSLVDVTSVTGRGQSPGTGRPKTSGRGLRRRRWIDGDVCLVMYGGPPSWETAAVDRG